MELPAGADAKLGEHLAQVVLNGAGADEQAGTNLRVRQTLSGQPRDLGLLGTQRFASRAGRSVKTHAMSYPSSASRFSWRNSSSCGTSSSVPMTKSATSFRSSSRNAAKLVILAIISNGPERD
jgi:hypothetical protein